MGTLSILFCIYHLKPFIELLTSAWTPCWVTCHRCPCWARAGQDNLSCSVIQLKPRQSFPHVVYFAWMKEVGAAPGLLPQLSTEQLHSYTSVPIFRGVTDAHHTRSCFRLNHKGYPHPPLHGLKKKQTNTGHFSHYIFKELRNHEVSQTRSKMKRGVPSHCVSQSSSAEPGSAFLSCALFKLRWHVGGRLCIRDEQKGDAVRRWERRLDANANICSQAAGSSQTPELWNISSTYSRQLAEPTSDMRQSWSHWWTACHSCCPLQQKALPCLFQPEELLSEAPSLAWGQGWRADLQHHPINPDPVPHWRNPGSLLGKEYMGCGDPAPAPMLPCPAS